MTNEPQQPSSPPPTPTPEPTAPSPTGGPPPVQGRPTTQNPLFVFDEKTIQTIQWSAIAAAVAGIIDQLFSYAAGRMVARTVVSRVTESLGPFAGALNQELARSGAYAFNPGNFFKAVVVAAIYGAIGGWVIAKFFPVFLRWNQQFLKGRIKTFFGLLFWPTIVGAFLLALLGAGFAFLTGFVPWLVMIIGLVASRFVYAKLMDAKVGVRYPVR